jgi:NADPH2:quinone reductase
MICRRLGPPGVLELADLPRPVLHPDQLRIAVHAAGVNFPDLLQVAGDYQHKPPLPFVPGFEAAGAIIEVGAAVAGWRPGDAVILRARGGGYAEEIVATSDMLLPKPAGWSWEEAAAFPVAAATAWVALIPRGRLTVNETLLVLGAGGGTGLAAVALGHRLGAQVIAVASSAGKRTAAQAAGATRCIDPAEAGWEATVQADAVFDPVGGALSATAWKSLAPGGRWLVVGFAGGEPPRPPANRLLLKEAELIGVRAGEQGRRDPAAGRRLQDALTELLVGGEMRPQLGGTYRLEEAARALHALADRRAVGKLVLRSR